MFTYLICFFYSIIFLAINVSLLKSHSPDTIVIAQIIGDEIVITYNQETIKYQLAIIYGSGTISEIKIEAHTERFILVGYASNAVSNYIIGHELIRIGSELIHSRIAIVEVHTCTPADICTSCTFRRDGLGNLVGCDCVATTSPFSTSYCNHSIEQRPVPY